MDEIDSFGNLPVGWNYGRGGPIPERTLQIAHRWKDFLHSKGFADVEAFPGDAEVCLAASDGDHYFEVIIESDETVSVAYDYKRKQVFYRLHMMEDQAREAADIGGRKDEGLVTN